MTSEKQGQKFHTLMMHHNPDLGSDAYGISVLIPQMSFHRETSGAIAKCSLFPQASTCI